MQIVNTIARLHNATDWFQPIERFLDWAGEREGALIYAGEGAHVRGRVRVFGWCAVASLAQFAFGDAADPPAGRN